MKAGKKESTGRRRDRHCPPCARPSSNSSLDHRRSDARAAENGFAAESSVNKSAKVVLEPLLNRATACSTHGTTHATARHGASESPQARPSPRHALKRLL